MFNKSKDDVLTFLTDNGYVHFSDEKEFAFFVKKGAVNDSLAVIISFENSILRTFLFRTKSTDEKRDVLADTLTNKLRFVKMSGSVLKDKGKMIGTFREYLNTDTRMKCRMFTNSYTEPYTLSVVFLRK